MSIELTFDKMEKWAIGVDLGGTKIEAEIISGNGKLLDKIRIQTEGSHGPESVVNRTVRIIETLMNNYPGTPISAIGIGVAGQIDKQSGSVIYAPNLKWENINLQSRLKNRVKVPVFVCNDVRAAAWGEWMFGAGMGSNNMICIFVGTGVGGALVCDGNMLEGYNNTAGEIGHLTIDVNGPMCTCGNYGCLEAIAGGWAIQREAQKAVSKNRKAGKAILHFANGVTENVTAEAVILAALAGDKLAISLVDNVVRALTAGVVSVVNVIGPDQVILGGGIVEGMPAIVDRLEIEVKKNALKAAFTNVKISRAQLHGNSGTIGAAIFALNKLDQKDFF